MNNKKITVIVAILFGIILLWVWLAQNNYFMDENDKSSTAGQEINLEDEPKVRLIFPGNQAILNPGPLVAQYSLSGETSNVQRVDFELIKNGETVIKVSGSFSPVSNSGSQMIRTVEEGEYTLKAMLVNQTGEYFESSESAYISFFKVQKSYFEE
ncbi:MAG: hypothetical protein WCW66_00775 [Patescibacteria group bacterium]|jgi:hypothetical protein